MRLMPALLPLVALMLMLAQPLGAQQIERPRLDALTEAQLDSAFRNFREYLSIPNDAHFPEDIRKVLEWMDAALTARGFETRELPTEGSPLLFGERKVEGAEKTVLVYLQSDGQPVDPTHWE